jgi:alkanesulfonate monooxygenase SsuD/methylene tetrahydromethanopterin reductase-like flavin-dependent oxidoreductase (luciferase family)
MDIGVMAMQTWGVDAWSAPDAYRRAVELAVEAERLGFESTWAWDHVYAGDDPRATAILEPFILLTSIAAATSRIRLGHMVLCAGFRNAALTAKMAATLDVASGGRFELGIGAGWKESEWRAYGYGFPPVGDRTAALGEQLEILEGMLGPGSATVRGRFASAEDAVTVPRGVQEPRIPIIVGGNGRRVTRRLAALHADELNLVYVASNRLAEELEITRRVCEEVGRDPATLRVSVYAIDADIQRCGPERVELLEAYACLGVSRLVANLDLQDAGRSALQALAADCRATPLVSLAA